MVTSNDSVEQICIRLFESFNPDILIDGSDSKEAANAAQAIGLPLVSANLVHRQHPTQTGKHAVIFKSPSRLMLEVSRDLITQYELSRRKIRVLYDDEYSK